jgi:hypothetical protein
MSLIYAIDIAGTFVFTISGSLAASDKKHHHDIFSVFFTGFITAIGGGTIRDVTLGAYPVAWINDINYLLAVFAGVFFTLVFRRYIIRLSRTLSLFDTIGMAIYVVLGVQKSLSFEVNLLAAIVLRYDIWNFWWCNSRYVTKRNSINFQKRNVCNAMSVRCCIICDFAFITCRRTVQFYLISTVYFCI